MANPHPQKLFPSAEVLVDPQARQNEVADEFRRLTTMRFIFS